MRRLRPLAFLVGVLLLAGGAYAAAAGPAPKGSTPLLAIGPPSGAFASQVAVPPFETVSSPYLHTTLATYVVALRPQEVYAYYLPRLERLGYRKQGQGTSGDRSGITSWDWSFSRGQDMSDTVLLTVEPDGTKSVYSIARELIEAPARPKASIVPAKLEEVTVRARQSVSQPWVTRTLRTPEAWHGILAAANALPMDTRGAHGCAADFGAAATVRFVAKSGAWTFTVDPACDSVLGPGGTHLMDTGLWTSAAAVEGFHVAAAGAGPQVQTAP